MVTTPALRSALRERPGVLLVITVNPGFVCDSSWRERAGQLLQQDLGFPQVGGVEALGEPAVDFCQGLGGSRARALCRHPPYPQTSSTISAKTLLQSTISSMWVKSSPYDPPAGP